MKFVATGGVLTHTAINGTSLEDALKSAIVGGIVDTVHGNVASQIKTVEADIIAHTLAHALAGCVAGAAAGGACQDGAIGAAVGELVARLNQPANGHDPYAYLKDVLARLPTHMNSQIEAKNCCRIAVSQNLNVEFLPQRQPHRQRVLPNRLRRRYPESTSARWGQLAHG